MRSYFMRRINSKMQLHLPSLDPSLPLPLPLPYACHATTASTVFYNDLPHVYYVQHRLVGYPLEIQALHQIFATGEILASTVV